MQQSTRTRLLDLHGKPEKSYIVDSYTGVKNNKEETYRYVTMATIVKQIRHNITLYINFPSGHNFCFHI
jgi:hypothetical protein